jgi:hypothetical protein
MQIKYLKFMQKWLASYQGKAIGIGNTAIEAIGQALEVITRK